MKPGRLFCLSGLGAIAVALILAHTEAGARSLPSRSDLDRVCGGQCGGSECWPVPEKGCPPAYGWEDPEVGCEPIQNPYPPYDLWCPDNTEYTSCNQSQNECGWTPYPDMHCTGQVRGCTGWYQKAQCVADNRQPLTCFEWWMSYYPCLGTYNDCPLP
jgi:hypothetical protein